MAERRNKDKVWRVRQKENLEQIIGRIVTNFIGLEREGLDRGINEALKTLGTFLEADRVYIFEYRVEQGICTNTFEWCKAGILPMIEELQAVPLDGIIPWVTAHGEGKDIYIPDVLTLTEEDEVRQILLPQGVKSLLAVPLFHQGTCMGFLGMDSVTHRRSYTLKEQEILHRFGQTLLFVLEKNRAEVELLTTRNHLRSVLNAQQELILQVDPEGWLRYANDTFLRIYGQVTGLKPGENIIPYLLHSPRVQLQEGFERLNAGAVQVVMEDTLKLPAGEQLYIQWTVYRAADSSNQVVYQAVGRDVTEARNAQKSLRQERDRLRYTLEASALGTWEWNCSTGAVEVNEHWAEILGYRKEDLEPVTLETWAGLLHPEDLPHAWAGLSGLLQPGKDVMDLEYRMRHREGRWVWIRDQGRVLLRDGEGNAQLLFGTHYDTTATREEAEKMRSIVHAIENSPVMVMVTDPSGALTYVNGEFSRVTGYSMEEVLGKNPRFLHSGHHDPAFFTQMWTTLQAGETWEGKLRNRKKSGESYWEMAQIAPVKGKDGQVISYVGIKEDITEKLALEDLQHQMKEQLLRFSQQVPGAIYQYRVSPDGSSSFPMASPGMAEIFELAPEELRGDASGMFQRIHPEDVEEVRRSTEKSRQELSPWTQQFRVLLPKKGLRWIRGMGSPQREEDGSTLWHGYLLDSTEEVEVREELRLSEERFRLAIEAADAGLWDWNIPAGKVTYSQRWKTMLGYTPDEIPDNFNAWSSLWHPQDKSMILGAMAGYLHGKTQKYEVVHRLRCKSGEYRWILTRGGMIRGPKGEPLRWVGTNVDLTAMKNIEKELAEMNSQLEELVSQKVRQVAETQKGAIAALAKLAEIRDPDTGRHIERVQAFCQLLATFVREESPEGVRITPEDLDNLYYASLLHDIGKVAISDAILLKPGKLTPEEYAMMKNHTTIGADTLEVICTRYPGNRILEMALQIARSHHEQWDGSGYPQGLHGDEIPLPARIMALADVYDALRSSRPYKDGMSHEEALEIIRRDLGRHYDPSLGAIFLAHDEAFNAIYGGMQE